VIPELRPRGIGEILDAAVSLYRARFGLLVRYAAIVVVPVQLFLTVVLLSAQPDRFSVTVNGNATPQFDTGRAQLGATVVVLLVGWLTNAFVEAVTARIVAGAYVDSGEAGNDAARAAVRRIPAVIAVALLVGLCEVAGLFVCGVGAFAAQAFFAVAIPVVILERKSVFGSMGRSIELTRTHFWHVLGLVIAAASITALLNAALAAGLNLWSSRGASATAVVVAQGLVNVVASVITTPFVAAAVVALYFDLRIRDEAFDVQMAMAAA
jgi:hypothetical protein